MATKKNNNYSPTFWDCDNNHLWKSYPGAYQDTWHLEQLHPATTATFMKLDERSAWLVSGPDPSVCPLCAMRMKIIQPSRSTSEIKNQKASRILA